MTSFAKLHELEADLSRRAAASPTDPALAAKLDSVRKEMAAHHDALFRIDPSPEAITERLGLNRRRA